jgi:hypothetical protein
VLAASEFLTSQFVGPSHGLGKRFVMDRSVQSSFEEPRRLIGAQQEVPLLGLLVGSGGGPYAPGGGTGLWVALTCNFAVKSSAIRARLKRDG